MSTLEKRAIEAYRSASADVKVNGWPIVNHEVDEFKFLNVSNKLPSGWKYIKECGPYTTLS